MVVAALTAVAVRSASVCLRELSFQMLWVAAAVAAVPTAAAAAGQEDAVAQRGCCADDLNCQHQLAIPAMEVAISIAVAVHIVSVAGKVVHP